MLAPAAPRPGPTGRSFLFLQGMATDFFGQLGQALQRGGHAVHRINFNAGDRLFWPLPDAIDFRGRAAEWPEFLTAILVSRKVTDVILFGDCRPLHRQAIRVCRDLQLTVSVCEEGYLRPHWVTFERDGVNGHSTLPRNPDWYRDVSRSLPPLEPPPAIPSSFRKRAWQDLIYNLTTLVLGPLYPHYQTHRPRHRMVEYAGWSWKMARRPWTRRRVAAELARITPQTRFFLFPLQLEGDTQIQLHSRSGSMLPVIRDVIDSFARHAAPGTALVVKEHPLDDGLIPWRHHVTEAATAAGVADRVIHLELGNIDQLTVAARGVVTVNSTTGTLALAVGTPVITLGTAIYDIPGLTHQGELSTFWTAPTPPDAALFAAFRQVLVSRCLLVGDFFSRPGIEALVTQAVARLEATVPGRPFQLAGIAGSPAEGLTKGAIPT
jgi:capsular polysaccharide export protein